MSHLVYIFQYNMIGFDLFLKNSNFDRVTAGWRRAAPGCTGIFIFGHRVRIENLGKVTKFGYHTNTAVDMPEPNVVPWVTLIPPSLSRVNEASSYGRNFDINKK